jgi:hypothetical protein
MPVQVSLPEFILSEAEGVVHTVPVFFGRMT